MLSIQTRFATRTNCIETFHPGSHQSNSNFPNAQICFRFEIGLLPILVSSLSLLYPKYHQTQANHHGLKQPTCGKQSISFKRRTAATDRFKMKPTYRYTITSRHHYRGRIAHDIANRSHPKDMPQWVNLGGISLWSWNSLSEPDRDAVLIPNFQLQEAYIPPPFMSITPNMRWFCHGFMEA